MLPNQPNTCLSNTASWEKHALSGSIEQESCTCNHRVRRLQLYNIHAAYKSAAQITLGCKRASQTMGLKLPLFSRIISMCICTLKNLDCSSFWFPQEKPTEANHTFVFCCVCNRFILTEQETSGKTITQTTGQNILLPLRIRTYL